MAKAKVLNAFDDVKPVVAPAPKSKAASLAGKVRVKGLQDYGGAVNVLKELTSLVESLKAEINAQAKEMFLAEVEKTGKRPENYKAIDGKAEGSLQFKKRSAVRALSDDEVEALDANGVPYDTVVATVETYVIDPEVLKDTAKMKKIGEAVGKLGFVGVFQHQPEVSKRVVSEETIDTVIKNGKTAELFDTVFDQAVRATMTDNELAWNIVGELIGKRIEDGKQVNRKAFAKAAELLKA